MKLTFSLFLLLAAFAALSTALLAPLVIEMSANFQLVAETIEETLK